MAATATERSTSAAPSFDPRRRKLIAIAHIAPKQLGMTDDDYRAVLMRETGRASARDCTTPELEALAAEFRRRGFSATARRPGQPARADHPMARKARTMWICLSLLCAIDVEPDAAIRGDKALEAFAKRQLGCDRLQWANQSQSDRLIEGLKAIAQRHGWDQSQAKLAKVHYVRALKVRLCDAILLKLQRAGLAGVRWTLCETAFRLCGIGEPTRAVVATDTQELERIATALGKHLRKHGGRGAFEAVAA